MKQTWSAPEAVPQIPEPAPLSAVAATEKTLSGKQQGRPGRPRSVRRAAGPFLTNDAIQVASEWRGRGGPVLVIVSNVGFLDSRSYIVSC